MKSKRQIKKRIIYIQHQITKARRDGDDERYKRWILAKKQIDWVME